jgi:hypothetical protein
MGGEPGGSSKHGFSIKLMHSFIWPYKLFGSHMQIATIIKKADSNLKVYDLVCLHPIYGVRCEVFPLQI